MKDQHVLLKKCLNNDIPAIVFQGSDSCAIEILQAAEAIYRKNGCSPEFMKDFHYNVVENFKAYQQENSLDIKLPDLTESEKEAFRILDERQATIFPSQIKDFEQYLKNNGFIKTNEETVSHGHYILSEKNDWIGIIGKNGDYELSINYNKETKQLSYFVFSNDPQYPERIGDYISLKTCATDIMFKHPLHSNSQFLNPLVERYHQLGYDNIVTVLEKYAPHIENINNLNNGKYTIANIDIKDSGSKKIIGDIIISQSDNSLITSIDNYRLLDKSTGKTESLNIGNIDLSSQPSDTIGKLLSGKQIEMKNKAGFSQLASLTKTPIGWGLTIGKQVFNTLDASADM